MGLIPIKLHLKKLRGRAQLRALALPTNHIIHSLMDSSFRSSNIPHSSFLSNFTSHQRMSDVVHTRVEVRRMDSEMSGLVEWPWLQLMCCAVCLPHGRNFRWRGGSPSGSECWMVCCRWTPEIEFNKRLSLLIIRLVNYSVTTSLIYKLIR